MHAGPRRTRLVRAAIPASSETDSIRGLPSRLSPTQTDRNNPDWSAASARSSIWSGVVAPSSTPRLGSVRPMSIVGSFLSYAMQSVRYGSRLSCVSFLQLQFSNDIGPAERYHLAQIPRVTDARRHQAVNILCPNYADSH